MPREFSTLISQNTAILFSPSSRQIAKLHKRKATENFRQGNYVKALQALEVCLEVEPKDVKALAVKIDSLVAIQCFEDAIALVNDFLSQYSSQLSRSLRSKLEAYLACLYLSDKQVDKAGEISASVLTLDPNQELALRARARLDEKRASYERKKQILDSQLAREPQNLAYLRQRAGFFIEFRQYDRAHTDYDDALAIAPEDVLSLFGKAKLYLSQEINLGNRLQALELLNKILFLKSDFTAARCLRACLLTKLERFSQAQQDFRQLRFELPEDAEMVWMHATVLEHLGLKQAALEKIELLCSHIEQLQVNLAGLGSIRIQQIRLLYDLGRYQEALEIYPQLLSIEPHQPLHYTHYAQLLCHLQRPEDAMVVLDFALTLAPQNIDNLLARAHLHILLEDYDLAREDLQRVIELQEDNVQAKTMLDSLLGQSNSLRLA